MKKINQIIKAEETDIDDLTPEEEKEYQKQLEKEYKGRTLFDINKK